MCLALEGGVVIIVHAYTILTETRHRLVDGGRPVVTTLSQLHFHHAFEGFDYSVEERKIYDRHWQVMQADFVTGVSYVLGTELIGRYT